MYRNLVNLPFVNSSLKTSAKCLFDQSRAIVTTAPLFGEPMKKKKKMDPMQFKLKVERKVKKLEKEIRKLSKTKPQLKPLIEYQLPPEILKDLNTRKRKEAGLEEAEEQMSKIAYLCNVYRSEQVKQEMHSFRNMVRSQSKALKELRECSEQLYQAAISIDQNLIPFSDLKSVKLTPAVKDYTPPDGRKHDITKQWKM